MNGKDCSFAQYRFLHEENHTTYILLANKDESHYLMPELKNFDYLLVVSGALDFFDEDTVKQPFKNIPVLQIIYEVDINQLRSKQNLMYLVL